MSTAVSYTEISATTSGPVRSVSPNGSSSGIDYYTTVIRRQDWSDGRSYRITETWISPDPRFRGQLIGRVDEPW